MMGSYRTKSQNIGLHTALNVDIPNSIYTVTHLEKKISRQNPLEDKPSSSGAKSKTVLMTESKIKTSSLSHKIKYYTAQLPV